jgi:hypothetical protein
MPVDIPLDTKAGLKMVWYNSNVAFASRSDLPMISTFEA